MSEDQKQNPWRSLEALLSAYAEGALNQVDLYAALIGLLDLVSPERIYEMLPEWLRPGFVEHARGVVEHEPKIFNLVTGEPLPSEAFEKLVTWVKVASAPRK